jgi:hypothetical protein
VSSGENRMWHGDKSGHVVYEASSHGEREEEAPRAWLVEGATQAPVR